MGYFPRPKTREERAREEAQVHRRGGSGLWLGRLWLWWGRCSSRRTWAKGQHDGLREGVHAANIRVRQTRQPARKFLEEKFQTRGPP